MSTPSWATEMWVRQMTMRERRSLVHEKAFLASFHFMAIRRLNAHHEKTPAWEVASLG